MLRKEIFLRSIYWFDIRRFFVKWSCNLGVNCIISRKINSIIHFLNVNTIILSCIFCCNFLEFYNPNVIPFLNLWKQTIIKSWPTIQRSYLLFCQDVTFMLGHNHNVPSIFKVLLINLIISVIILFYGFVFLPSKCETNSSRAC